MSITAARFQYNFTNTQQIIYIHKNIPGVLRKVNEVLGNHNVPKQTSDSRGDVAYLLADVSDVNTDDIKDITESLEALDSRIMVRVLY